MAFGSFSTHSNTSVFSMSANIMTDNQSLLQAIESQTPRTNKNRELVNRAVGQSLLISCPAKPSEGTVDAGSIDLSIVTCPLLKARPVILSISWHSHEIFCLKFELYNEEDTC